MKFGWITILGLALLIFSQVAVAAESSLNREDSIECLSYVDSVRSALQFFGITI